jgi:hypothetical protein
VTTTVGEPFHLQSWIDAHQSQLDSGAHLTLFPDAHASVCETVVLVIGANTSYSSCNEHAQMWVWQWAGSTMLQIDSAESIALGKADTVLVDIGKQFKLEVCVCVCVCVSVCQVW